MYSFLTDEHVPRVFITALRSNGHTVTRAIDAFGEGAVDEELLLYCMEHDLILITHDRKDFGGKTGEKVTHNGIIIYTVTPYLRDYPHEVAALTERILSHFPPEELANRIAWRE